MRQTRSNERRQDGHRIHDGGQLSAPVLHGGRVADAVPGRRSLVVRHALPLRAHMHRLYGPRHCRARPKMRHALRPRLHRGADAHLPGLLCRDQPSGAGDRHVLRFGGLPHSRGRRPQALRPLPRRRGRPRRAHRPESADGGFVGSGDRRDGRLAHPPRSLEEPHAASGDVDLPRARRRWVRRRSRVEPRGPAQRQRFRMGGEGRGPFRDDRQAPKALRGADLGRGLRVLRLERQSHPGMAAHDVDRRLHPIRRRHACLGQATREAGRDARDPLRPALHDRASVRRFADRRNDVAGPVQLALRRRPRGLGRASDRAPLGDSGERGFLGRRLRGDVRLGLQSLVEILSRHQSSVGLLKALRRPLLRLGDDARGNRNLVVAFRHASLRRRIDEHRRRGRRLGQRRGRPGRRSLGRRRCER